MKFLLAFLLLGATAVHAQVNNGAASVTGSGATGPTSVLTRPNNTTAYASGQLIASSITAGSAQQVTTAPPIASLRRGA